MINLKLTVISAILGLFFSLLIGLINQVSFGYLILRAIISAALTGGIAAAASFVFKKFLANESVTMANLQNTSSTGNVVDITLKVDEDVLPDADNAPPFDVSPEALRVKKPVEIYRMAAKQGESAETDTVNEPGPAEKPENEKAGAFVPQPLVSEKTPQYSLSRESVQEKKPDTREMADKSSNGASGGASSLEALDELPDLTDVAAVANDENDDVISDSDFATANTTPVSYTVGNEKKETDVGNDAVLMADTIRTLLKSEG